MKIARVYYVSRRCDVIYKSQARAQKSLRFKQTVSRASSQKTAVFGENASSAEFSQIHDTTHTHTHTHARTHTHTLLTHTHARARHTHTHTHSHTRARAHHTHTLTTHLYQVVQIISLSPHLFMQTALANQLLTIAILTIYYNRASVIASLTRTQTHCFQSFK